MSNDDTPVRFTDNEDEVTAMARCEDCGHMVPELNLTIHHATACSARARAPSPPSPVQSRGTASSPSTWFPSFASTSRSAERPLRSILRHDSSYYGSNTSVASASQNTTPRRRVPRNNREVIHIQDSPQRTALPQQQQEPTKTNTATTSATFAEWPCPRCTLLNPVARSHCDACQMARTSTTDSNTVRAPDPTRREALLPNSHSAYENPPVSPGSAIGSGALLGSVLGAAGAYLNGRSVGGGAIEGAMSGAMGAALVSSVWNDGSGQSQSMSAVQQHAFLGGQQATQHFPEMHSRASFRVVRQRTTNGSTLETVFVHSPNAAGVSLEHPSDDVTRGGLRIDPYRTVYPYPRARHLNLDNLSYEQMLDVFGDGSENRGASEGDIQSLPVSKVKDPFQLPEDKRQCSICLEEFQGGETRKVMGCLHGFHSDCIDKWLRTNGSCPVCKHRVGGQ